MEGKGVLTRNHRQEGLCRAYIQAVAAQCGMSASTPYPDYGIDMTLNEIELSQGIHSESGYRLDVQAKSATRVGRVEGVIRYDLDLRSYDVLRRPAPGSPRMLVVLLLPRDESRWCSQTEDQLVLRHCAYWISLRGWSPSVNRRSVRLSIPAAQMFSPDALRTIMGRIKTGETL